MKAKTLYLQDVDRKTCCFAVFTYNEVHRGVSTTYFLHFGKQYVVVFAFKFCLRRSVEIPSVLWMMELDYPVKTVKVIEAESKPPYQTKFNLSVFRYWIANESSSLQETLHLSSSILVAGIRTRNKRNTQNDQCHWSISLRPSVGMMFKEITQALLFVLVHTLCTSPASMITFIKIIQIQLCPVLP